MRPESPSPIRARALNVSKRADGDRRGPLDNP